MRVKNFNPRRFRLLKAGSAIELSDPRPRRVRLQLNVEALARVDIVYGDPKGKKVDALFVTAVQPTGPQEVEFNVDGACHIGVDSAGEVWWYTDEVESTAHGGYAKTAPFTSLDQNMDVTPQMETVMLKAALRREQRLREQAELRAKAAELATPHDPETGEVVDEPADSGNEEPATGEAAPVQPEVSQ